MASRPERFEEACGIQTAVREIVCLSKEQLDLVETMPLERLTEARLVGYRRRQKRIFLLCGEINRLCRAA